MTTMGLIRKAVSVSSLGAVKYTSRREAQTKAALEETRLLREQRKALQAERETTHPSSEPDDRPAWAQPTWGKMLRKIADDRKNRQD